MKIVELHAAYEAVQTHKKTETRCTLFRIPAEKPGGYEVQKHCLTHVP